MLVKKTSFNFLLKHELFKFNLFAKNYHYFLLGWLYNRITIEDHHTFLIKLHTNQFLSYLIKLLKKNQLCFFKYQIIKKKSFVIIKINNHNLTILKNLNFYFPDIFKDFKITNFKKLEFQSFIAGLFINCGYISNPKSNFYHLELKMLNINDQLLKIIISKLKKYGFNFKIMTTNNAKRCYLKKSTLIADFLKFLRAFKTLYAFENKTIAKNFLNNIQKSINLSLANQQKIIKASNQNLILINKIKKGNVFNLLPVKLKTLCQLRILNPDVGYHQLAILMNQKLDLDLNKNDIFLMFKKLKLWKI